jgi:hypothetical protein
VGSATERSRTGVIRSTNREPPYAHSRRFLALMREGLRIENARKRCRSRGGCGLEPLYLLITALASERVPLVKLKRVGPKRPAVGGEFKQIDVLLALLY